MSPDTISIATATLYKSWHPGVDREKNNADKIRGDLALATISEAKQKGYRIVVVDGGSSNHFLSAVRDLGIEPEVETDHGMSGSRRQGLTKAANLPHTKVVVWTEEKHSFVKDCLWQAAQPILNRTARLVIPKREEHLFDKTYCPYQVKTEKEINRQWNEMVKNAGFLPPNSEDLDVTIGPRLFTPEMLPLFLRKYQFKQSVPGINPELWANALFLPVVNALHEGDQVVSVTVPYSHSTIQSAFENATPEYDKKRDFQVPNVLVPTQELIKLLKKDPSSRLVEMGK